MKGQNRKSNPGGMNIQPNRRPDGSFNPNSWRLMMIRNGRRFSGTYPSEAAAERAAQMVRNAFGR